MTHVYNGWKVIPSVVNIDKRTGQRFSPYGARPWGATAADIRHEQTGYTVENTRNGQVGIGRMPWPTEAEAIAWAKAAQPAGWLGMGD